MKRVSLALQSDKSWNTYCELAIMVERLGFDGLSVYGDLGYQPPIGALLAAASATSHIELGPACLNPYVLNPLEIAGQHAVLDEASGGRAYLGLARGSWLGRVGIDQNRPLRTLSDTIEIVRRLLRGDRHGWKGSAHELAAGMTLNWDPPRRDVDVLLGVWGPMGAKLAGRSAQQVKIGGTANPDMVAAMRGWVDDAAVEALRPSGSVRVAAGAVTVVDEDAKLARAIAREQVAMYVEVVAPLDPTVEVDPQLLSRLARLLEAGRKADAGALLPDDLLNRFAFAGSPSDVAAQAVSLFDAGADRVEFGTPHGVQARHGIHLLGTRVLPEVRDYLGVRASDEVRAGRS